MLKSLSASASKKKSLVTRLTGADNSESTEEIRKGENVGISAGTAKRQQWQRTAQRRPTGYIRADKNSSRIGASDMNDSGSEHVSPDGMTRNDSDPGHPVGHVSVETEDDALARNVTFRERVSEVSVGSESHNEGSASCIQSGPGVSDFCCWLSSKRFMLSSGTFGRQSVERDREEDVILQGWIKQSFDSRRYLIYKSQF
jgi:hypothetical protein